MEQIKHLEKEIKLNHCCDMKIKLLNQELRIMIKVQDIIEDYMCNSFTKYRMVIDRLFKSEFIREIYYKKYGYFV